MAWCSLAQNVFEYIMVNPRARRQAWAEFIQSPEQRRGQHLLANKTSFPSKVNRATNPLSIEIHAQGAWY